MKTWVRILFVILVAAAVYFLPVACTAPIQVQVRVDQENYQCPADVVNRDGVVNLNNCHKEDGDSPSDQKSEDGPDTLEVSWLPFFPSLN